jgi:hypothetical protein
LDNEAILAGPSDSLTEINVEIDQQCFDPANSQGDAGAGRPEANFGGVACSYTATMIC